MKFGEFVNNKNLSEYMVESIETVEELDTLNEELELLEAQLNEFLGLGKVADKIKSGAERLSKFSSSTDKAIDTKKKEARDYVDAKKAEIEAAAKGVKYAAERKVNAAKDAVTKKVEDIKTSAEENREEMKRRKEEIGKRFSNVLANAKNVFQKFGTAVVDSLTPEQKELAKELAPIFNKLKRGGVVTGDQALSIFAAVQSGITHGGDFPTKKAYDVNLKKLRSQPGLASFSFSVSYNKGPGAQENIDTSSLNKQRVEEPKEEIKAVETLAKKTPKAKKEVEVEISDKAKAAVKRSAKWLDKK